MVRRSSTLEFKTFAAKLVRDQEYSIVQADSSLGIDTRTPPRSTCAGRTSSTAPKSSAS